jgi:hypothetical protein
MLILLLYFLLDLHVAVVISLIPLLLGQSGPNRGQPFWLSAIYIGVLYMMELSCGVTSYYTMISWTRAAVHA